MRRLLFSGLTAVILSVVFLQAPVQAARVNVCPVNGQSGIFKATGPISVADRVMDTPAFAGDPTTPGGGPFWAVQ